MQHSCLSPDFFRIANSHSHVNDQRVYTLMLFVPYRGEPGLRPEYYRVKVIIKKLNATNKTYHAAATAAWIPFPFPSPLFLLVHNHSPKLVESVVVVHQSLFALIYCIPGQCHHVVGAGCDERNEI